MRSRPVDSNVPQGHKYIINNTINNELFTRKLHEVFEDLKKITHNTHIHTQHRSIPRIVKNVT